jgi:hypothetical protein
MFDFHPEGDVPFLVGPNVTPVSLNPVSGLTTTSTPRIQPLDRSGTLANDGLSIDQSGTIHDHAQIWRETCKESGLPKLSELLSLSMI